jgi:glycogen debranching enzyme
MMMSGQSGERNNHNHDQYELFAADRASEFSRVLKQGDTFAIFDCHGDVLSTGMGEQGIFHEGTRFLSRWELRIGGTRPLLLSSTINERNELLAVDLMNPDLFDDHEVHVPKEALHFFRSKFLWRESCFERIRITNYNREPIRLTLTLSFASDFRDIFEVRGMRRSRRGEFQETAVGPSEVLFSYLGLDEAVRRTRLSFSPEPASLSASDASFTLELGPGEPATLYFTVSCECQGCDPSHAAYSAAFAQAGRFSEELREGQCEIETSNDQFNVWLNRSSDDLLMMLTKTPQGLYPFAGVPWFSTPFGRDGIITALEMLWMNPQVARGVLAYLAHTQAAEVNPGQDAEPGKILHETRKGEMAALGEIPFGQYYGSVDSTPLFVVLAGSYYERTGDQAFIEGIWPNILQALQWMDTYGDADGDGFLEYARHSEEGLIQQGWKDSGDSIFHADGSLAEGPIALCEVQGYAFQARRQAAVLAGVLGEKELAAELHARAGSLQEKFQQDFWCAELSNYAIALDGRKRPCRVRASNAGHCLFSGIASREHAALIAEELLSPKFFSGWGVRTIAVREARYNPMAYHNGSIWPHDNAMIAYGLARYGFTRQAMEILEGLFHTAIAVDLHRLPELFCGFERHAGLNPILYPLACAPQSWAAASVFLLLQACTGLFVDARSSQVRFSHPSLPPFLDEVRIKNLRVGSAGVDLLLKRYPSDVGINILRREGELEIVVVK